MMTNNPTKKINRSTALILGLFLFSIYLLVYRGGFHSVDEVSMFAVTESLAKFEQVNTNQIAWTQWTTTQAEAQGFFGRDGQVYSKKGLALSLAQLPLYWLALFIPNLGMLQTASLLNGLISAVSGMLIFLFARRLDYTIKIATAAALTFGLATITFIYAKYLFSEPLAGFLLLLAAYMLFAFKQEGGLRHVAIAGLAAGFAVLTRANNLFLLPIFGLYLLWVAGVQGGNQVAAWRNFTRPDTLKPVVILIGALAIPGFILMGYNAIRSGNPLQTGYDLTLFSPNILLGFYKLLFSPLRGLFVYSPILLMSLPGWWQLRRAHPAEAWLFAGLTGITVGLFSAWSSGEGLSWGSRFLVPVVPFFAISLTPVMKQIIESPKHKSLTILFYALLPLSLLIQLLGVAINPWVYLAKVQADFGGEFFLERTAALYNFGYSQIAGQLQSWSVQNSDLIWWQPWGFDTVAFGISATLVVLTSWSLAQAVREKSPWLRRALVPLLIASALVPLFLLTRYYATDRQFGPPAEPYTTALNQVAAQAAPADKIITVAPYHYHVPMNRFTARLPLIGMAQQTWPLPETAPPLLESTQTGSSVWLVTVGFPPTAGDNAAERWLAQNAFPASEEWIDDVRLLRYGTRPPATTRPIDISLGQNITLAQVRLLNALPAGQVLPVELTWLANEPPAENYQVFIQLLTADGTLAVQRDGPPNGGYTPITDWPINQPLTDRHGLALPANLPPGQYRLIAGLYNPTDGQRLITNTGVDFIELGHITISHF
jgi:hypothetical protein